MRKKSVYKQRRINLWSAAPTSFQTHLGKGARGVGTVLQDTLCSMSQLCITGGKPHSAALEKPSEQGQDLQNRLRTYKAPWKEKMQKGEVQSRLRICKHHPLRNILEEQQLWVIGSCTGSSAPFLPRSSLSMCQFTCWCIKGSSQLQTPPELSLIHQLTLHKSLLPVLWKAIIGPAIILLLCQQTHSEMSF